MQVEETTFSTKVKEALKENGSPVVELDTQTKKVRKFSVLVGTSTEFVHLYQTKASSTWFVSCQSGLCDSRYRKKRKALNLYEEEEGNRCIHLNKFKDFYLTNLHQGIVEANIDSVADANDDALPGEEVDENGLGSIEVSIITRFMHVRNFAT